VSEPNTHPTKALFTPRDAAAYLGLSASTLARMRSPTSKVKGPPYFRLGGSIKYKQAELDAWVEHNRQAAEFSAGMATDGRANDRRAE